MVAFRESQQGVRETGCISGVFILLLIFGRLEYAYLNLCVVVYRLPKLKKIKNK